MCQKNVYTSGGKLKKILRKKKEGNNGFGTYLKRTWNVLGTYLDFTMLRQAPLENKQLNRIEEN